MSESEEEELINAATYDDFEEVRRLLDSGVNINSTDSVSHRAASLIT